VKKAVPAAKKAAPAPLKKGNKVTEKKQVPAAKAAAKKTAPVAVPAPIHAKPKFKAKETISPNAKIEPPVPLSNSSITSMRYSDKDLAEFEALIKVKLEQAKSDLDELKLSLSHEGDNSTDDTSPTFKMMEDGNDTTSREEVAQLAARQGKFILSLENALLRIKNKTYGICRVTGKLIPKERLKLVPHATLSIEAKNMQ
jgi:RNA polymerase-binding transcription factor DksA